MKKPTEGENFTIDCLFEVNDPQATVKWERDGICFQNPLIFRPLTRNHTGNYTCIVSTKRGTNNKTLRVADQCKYV